MSVRLDNFVDVNITKRASAPGLHKFDTVVFLKDWEDGDDTPGVGYYSLSGNGNKTGESKENAFAYPKGTSVELDLFFENGGKYVHVVAALTESSDGKMLNLPNEEIIIFRSTAVSTQTLFGKVYSGVYQKIYLDYFTGTSSVPTASAGMFRKYNGKSSGTPGSLGATAAYFTKIDNRLADSVKDLAFTEEIGIEDVVDDDSVVKFCIANHLNCDVYLAGAVRNIGGDDSVGESVVNVFMRIVLQQTLQDTLINLLATKIKMNMSGIIAVKAAISSELTKYVNNGYIATDKSWTEEDLYIGNVLVVKKGSPISGGYYIYIPPITSLTPEQREAHQLPDVYIIYGDSEGVRKLVVNGEVF